MRHTLVAVFDNRSDAQNATNALLSSGFSSQDLRLSGPGTVGAAGGTPSDTGSGTGSGIKHFFSGLFGSGNDHHANPYEGAVMRGQSVITLGAGTLEEVERAADIVEGFGPVDIDEHSDGTRASGAMLAGSGSGMSSSSMSAQSASPQRQGALAGNSMQRDSGAQSIPVMQEQLEVGKRQVARGGVRIFSRLVEAPVTETITLREEHVDIRRRQLDPPISPVPPSAFEEKTIEVRETAEEAVVEKSARVVEEVALRKQVEQRQQQISDSVRHTEVGVARHRAAGQQDESYYRKHYQSNYANSGVPYDDYAPAYGYGSQMRSDSRYATRQWDEVEGDLRLSWETRNAGRSSSSWEKMKGAVRHGWDRMTDGGSSRS